MPKVPGIYNKERTKSKLIKAVGQILAKEGYQNIRVNKVAEKAGVAKKSYICIFWRIGRANKRISEASGLLANGKAKTGD